MKKNKLSVRVAAEIAIFAALAFAFDAIQGGIFKGVFASGGSIGFGMLPILVIAYRRGLLPGIICGFIVSIIYLMNKDTIDKYIEPVPLELTTDRVTVEYGEDIHFMDYIKYYDKSQQLTIPLNQKLNKIKEYKFVFSATNGVKTKEKALDSIRRFQYNLWYSGFCIYVE